MVRWPLTYFWVWGFLWGQARCSCPCLANPSTIHLGRLEAERSGGWWLGRVDFARRWILSLISPAWAYHEHVKFHNFFTSVSTNYQKSFLGILDKSKAAAPSLKARKVFWSEALKLTCLVIVMCWTTKWAQKMWSRMIWALLHQKLWKAHFSWSNSSSSH